MPVDCNNISHRCCVCHRKYLAPGCKRWSKSSHLYAQYLTYVSCLCACIPRSLPRDHFIDQGNPRDSKQQSKVCIQTFALLYMATFPCIPNCLGIMSQLITGDYVIKFERNSFI